ncbi:hypothetical protein As57867_022581, partial [Aphanomyces stellatus]
MPKLFCVVVGHEGSPFSVNIAADETVDDLKKKIKVEKRQSITCDADELELYHTLKGNTEVDEDVLRELKQQGSNDLTVKYVNDIAWMNPIKLLKRYLDANPPVEEQIHVLVVIPREMPPTGKRSIEELGEIVEASVNKAFKDRD